MSELKGCVLACSCHRAVGAVLPWGGWWGRLCLVAVGTCPVGPPSVGLTVAAQLGHTGRDSLCLTCSPAAYSRRWGLLSLALCSATEVSVFPRTPYSWKALSLLQASHLQSFAGKYSISGKAEMHSAASHSRQRARGKGF